MIDALRTDFVKNNDRWQMPYTNKELNESRACLYNIQVESPTVTMPRIKSMTTGTIPNFIDVVLNLGSSQVNTDSFIAQLKNQSKFNRIHFAGDNTWMKMFPNAFDVHAANNDSLFVNDFYNVSIRFTRMTRSGRIELEKFIVTCFRAIKKLWNSQMVQSVNRGRC